MFKIILTKVEGPINSDRVNKDKVCYSIKEANSILRDYQKEVGDVGYDKVDYKVEFSGGVFTGTYDLTKREDPKFQEVIKRKLSLKYKDLEDFVNSLV